MRRSHASERTAFNPPFAGRSKTWTFHSCVLKKHKKCPSLLEPFDWWNYAAPVCPPTWAIEAVKKTRRSVDWQNIFWDGKIAYSIFYRTRPATDEESDGDLFITHVLPGSYEVSKTTWLHRISNLPSPPGDGYW